jgi:phage FluMu protein Com
MYEIICPACRKLVEIPAQAVVIGTHSKCPKCWTILETVSDHPLRVIVSSSSSTSTPVHAGSDE